MDKIKLIEELTTAFGPSGFEEDLLEILKKYLKNLDVENDSMNNVYAKYKNPEKKNFTVQLDAHTDEVGFMVQSVLDNGTLAIVPLGGWVLTNVPAHLVGIRNRDGKIIEGITGSTPPHFMTKEERDRPLDIEKIFIDIGAMSYEEVIEDFKIEPGAPVAPIVDFRYDKTHDLIRGKAFDNRLGCACIVETMNRLKDNDNLNVNLVGAFAAQEEVGMRGAKVTSQKVKPDLAIVFEGSPADDLYFAKKQAQGVLGAGVQIRHFDKSYIGNPEYIKLAKDLAEENNIIYQSAIRRAGSTNAGAIHLSNEGVPVLVLGVPSRFVHSHYNFARLSDFEAAVDLAIKVIENLNDENIKKILKK
ncbi:M42 family metallopeptidase [Lagierella massiliensis]|uniref:M42 family metallopeptidase n=1 Tax=Lagierella massiliensis TaxID=1689303 RepID=UPI0006D84449|nr:M20/M25/M40 family metallo-hydrolase [Lagierella massiliensis]